MALYFVTMHLNNLAEIDRGYGKCLAFQTDVNIINDTAGYILKLL